MTKRFHINAKGEPGKCSAFVGKCPYGGEKDHFDSKEQAQRAFEQGQGGSFAQTVERRYDKEVKISRSQMKTLALTSDNPDVLMEIATHAGGLGGRKIAKALAQNKNTPREVLVEARSHTDLAWLEYVALESHPNYPLSQLTGEGATKITSINTPEQVQEMMKSNDVGDTLPSKALFREQGSFNNVSQYTGDDWGVKLALANPQNKMTAYGIGSIAVEGPEYTRAAAQSGRFPTMEDINGNTHFYDSRAQQRGPVSDQVLVNAAEYCPDNTRLEAIYDKVKNTPYGESAAKAIFNNKNASDTLKNKIAKDSTGWLKEAQERLRRFEP